METKGDEHVVARPRVACQSRIVGVAVYSRGAVITRRIVVEDALPSESFDLVVDDVTPLADPGSVRVRLPEEGRKLVAVNARWKVPEVDDGPGPTVDRVEKLNRQLDALRERESALRARAQRLRDFMPAPVSGDAIRDEGPVARIGAALEVVEVVRDMMAATDRRLVEVRNDIEELQRERSRAKLEDSQTSTSDRMGAGHPRRSFELHIASGEGDVGGGEFSYAVPRAAKWWPMYSLRLTDGGRRATLTLEAVVAQRTGEDWDGVPIGLSTSEIVYDATLPRLPSLRLGKRQPSKRSGFREPPAGTDRLFEGYDAFRGRYGSSAAPRAPKKQQVEQREARSEMPAAAPGAAPKRDQMATGAWDADETVEGESLEEVTGSYPEFERGVQQSAPQAASRSRSKMGGVSGAVADGFGSATETVAAESVASFSDSPAYPGGGGGGAPAEAPPTEHDPGEHWLAFDSLVLAGPDASNRGRLRHRSEGTSFTTSDLYDARESARRLELVDPAVSRGLFDYRYDSDGDVQVPADGRLHRIALQRADSNSRLVWRTVPVGDPAVYREAELDNPFPSPLLSGPVDVFSEGQLVTTTHIGRVDSGGSMRVGLGVDDRFRVARNVRMNEESAGLLGGKRELIHDVEIELRSALGFDSTVDVYDRIPRSGDDSVSVELISADPPADEYDQSDRDAPIEGGMHWSVNLAGGGRQTIHYQYEVCLRSKDEIVGGNRRD